MFIYRPRAVAKSRDLRCAENVIKIAPVINVRPEVFAFINWSPASELMRSGVADKKSNLQSSQFGDSYVLVCSGVKIPLGDWNLHSAPR